MVPLYLLQEGISKMVVEQVFANPDAKRSKSVCTTRKYKAPVREARCPLDKSAVITPFTLVVKSL